MWNIPTSNWRVRDWNIEDTFQVFGLVAGFVGALLTGYHQNVLYLGISALGVILYSLAAPFPDQH